MSDAADRLLSGDAWRAFCAELAELADVATGDGFPSDARERAEGFRALTRWLAYALRMEVECGDPLHPQLGRYEEPHTQWGGPNPDNVYLRAAIDPDESYRVWGNLAGVRQVIASLNEGDMQQKRFGVYSEQSLGDWRLGAGRALELVIARERPPGAANWMPMHDDARLFQVRIFVADWERDAAPALHIERIGAEGVPPPPPDPAALAAALARASAWVRDSLHFWNTYTREAFARAEPNRPATPRATPGGADNILYGSCVWDLGPDDALVLDCEPPDARYWGFCIHTSAWLESGDFANRPTSLNDTQLHRDADGRVRVVLAARDPGVPNWIDTEGRRRGLLVQRCVWANTAPKPEAEVVRVEDVRARMPDGHPVIDADERRRLLRRRRELLWSRYL